MAILDFTTAPVTSPARSNANRRPFAGQATEQQADSQIWMNFGYEIGEGEAMRFINLPYGIAIDTMREADTRGSNEDFVKQQHARNEFLSQLKAVGATLAPGEHKNVIEVEAGPIKWVIQLRRVKGEMQVDQKQNEYAVNFATLFQAAAE